MATITRQEQEIPIACDLSAIPADLREAHIALARQLFSEAVLQQQELTDGYAFRFGPDEYQKVATFIADERLCCPFFHFSLEVAPARGPLWLRITGGEGVKEFIGSEFTRE